MTRGNPYPHRYKFGVLKKPIDFPIFEKLMARVERVDRCGYKPDFLIAAHALFYWTGLRLTEVIGRKSIKWKVRCKACKGIGCPKCRQNGYVFRIGPPHPGILKEDIKLEEGFILVYSIDENVLKHGNRVAPIFIPTQLPYVDVIIKQWQKTKPKHRVFPINKMSFWRICKRLDAKFTTHFYRHNRLTDLSSDPKNSMADICSVTGLSPATVGKYVIRAGRFSRHIGERMGKRFAEN